MKSLNSSVGMQVVGEWSTPQALFQTLDAEFHFTLDACAQPFNAKCAKFYTKADDGLAKNWGGERVFCNPPSSAKNFKLWVAKAATEAKKKNTMVVMLLPASTDTQWFHNYIYLKRGVTVRFFDHRIEFVNQVRPSWAVSSTATSKRKKSANRPTMLVVFSGGKRLFRVE